MPLVKFPSLAQGMGACWIDLRAIVSIAPLFGTPHPKPGTSPCDDDSRRVPIGSRVAVGAFIFDLDIAADDLAAEVEHVTAEKLVDLSHDYGAVAGAH